MEFVLVTFPVPRGVVMDGAPQGSTGQVLGVQRGHHVFDLGSPVDYQPPSIAAAVTNTTQAQPMVMSFQQVTAAIPPEAAEAAAPTLAPRPRKASKKTGKVAKRASGSPRSTEKKPAPKGKTGGKPTPGKLAGRGRKG